MKNLFMLCFFPISLYAQIPVTDAAANSQLGVVNGQLSAVNANLASLQAQSQADYLVYGQILQQSVSSVQFLSKQLNFLDSIQNELSKVSRGVRQANYLARIIDNQVIAVQRVENIAGLIDDTGFDENTSTIALSEANLLLAQTERLVSLARSYATDGFFNANDTERVKALEETLQATTTVGTQLNVLYRRWKRRANARTTREIYK